MLAVIWHSRTGAARALAAAAYDGALEGGAARMIAAEAATPDDLLEAGGYLFVAPENLAALSGAMKEFFDRCYYPLLGRIEGRSYATVIAAGSDGTGALRQLDRIATGWRLRRAAEPLIAITHAQTPEAILATKSIPAQTLVACREMGQALSTGIALGIF